MPMTEAAHPHLDRDLRALTADGIAFSAMVGLGETYVPAFALGAGLGEVVSGLVATVPMLAGACLQMVLRRRPRAWRPRARSRRLAGTTRRSRQRRESCGSAPAWVSHSLWAQRLLPRLQSPDLGQLVSILELSNACRQVRRRRLSRRPVKPNPEWADDAPRALSRSNTRNFPPLFTFSDPRSK